MTNEKLFEILADVWAKRKTPIVAYTELLDLSDVSGSLPKASLVNLIEVFEEQKSTKLKEWQELPTNSAVSRGGEAAGIDFCIAKLNKLLKQ